MGTRDPSTIKLSCSSVFSSRFFLAPSKWLLFPDADFLKKIARNVFFFREAPTGSDCHEARIYVNRPQATPCAVVAPALLVCTARFFFVANACVVQNVNMHVHMPTLPSAAQLHTRGPTVVMLLHVQFREPSEIDLRNCCSQCSSSLARTVSSERSGVVLSIRVCSECTRTPGRHLCS